jgi:streptogramin lyase
MLAAAASAVLVLRGASADGRRVAALTPASVAFLDAHSVKLLGQIPVGPAAGPVRFGAGAVWKVENDGRLVEMLDPRAFRVLRSIPTGVALGELAVGERAVWVSGGSTVVRIDPTYGSIDRRIPLPTSGLANPRASSSITVGAGSLWVAQGHARVLRLDPASGRVEHRFDIPNAQIVAFGDGAVWAAGSDLGTLTRIDPNTNTIAATTRIGPSICCLAVGNGYAWATNDTGLWKVSASGDPATTIRLPNEADFLAYGDGAAWVTVKQLLLRVDAATNAVTRHRFTHPLNGIAVDRGRVAVSVGPGLGDALAGLHGHVLNAGFGAIWFDVTDPAVSAAPSDKNWATEQQLQQATCAPLLGYGNRSELVPEAAAAPPSVSPDGRTYRFTIRSALRFSPPSNAPVTARTFKYSIERALSPQLGPRAPALRDASDIVGLHAYRTGAAAHIAGISTTGDKLTITLARRAPDFPERIAATYFCPVPLGTPAVADGLQDPIPSAGPYYLSANQGGTVAVLRRNPNYHGPQPHRLDAIVFRQYAPIGEMVARVRAGRTDYVAERATDLAPDAPLAQRYSRSSARRYFLSPLLGTDELSFRRHALLASARLRRAIDLALDRQALATAMGDRVTDRFLPSGLTGAAESPISEPVHGPDLPHARALIGGRRGSLRLAVCEEPECLQVGQIVRANLRGIGLRVVLRTYGGDIGAALHRRGADMVLTRVLAPYPDPVAFLKAALGDAAPSHRLAEIARMDRTPRLAAANRLDVALARGRAPAAAFGTPAIPEFFSARVGCQRFPPVSFGVELGALCLHGQ